MRYLAILLGLLAAAVGIRSQLTDAVARVSTEPVPDTVLQTAAQGRYWHATRLLDEHLDEASDTAPSVQLLAARLNAGWNNWPTVSGLLDGRPWLDTLEGGVGLALLGQARAALGDPTGGAAAYAEYLAMADLAPDQRGLVELRRGLALGRADSTGPALAAFDRAAELIPWFADWASYLAAETAAEAGEPAEVERRLAAAGAAGAGHWRLRVSAALEAGDTMSAREAAVAATRVGARTSRSEAWAELGRLRLVAGESDRAREAFVRAMEVRSATGAVEAARRLRELGPEPREWRTIAETYEWHGNAARAAEGFQAYLDSGAGTPAERAEARLRLARARYNMGRLRQAERGLLTLAAGDVPDRIAAEALYLAARAQYRQGRNDDGQATFLRLAERYPDHDATGRGLFLLADLKHDELDTEGPEGARTFYRRAADAAPDLNESGLALMRLAGLAFLEGDYEGAVEVWEAYRDRHPDGRRSAQATYWAARAYDRMGRDSLARARLLEVRRADPISFYGARAAELLGEPILAIPMDSAPARQPSTDSLVRAGLRRVDLLAELDRRDDLVQEVERLRRRFQTATWPGAVAGEYALAEALNERGYTLTGIGMGWHLYERSREWNRRLLRLVYPFPFRTLVMAEARDQGLDPYLVAGVIRRESAFSPVVVSRARAVGLMQIMPATGRALARGAGLPFDTDLLTRPEVNIHLGTRFFADLVDRFDGDLPLVLAAYNAGPTRASEWRRLPEAEDPELFTERIPYGETRDYVRYVLLHQALYRALYADIESVG